MICEVNIPVSTIKAANNTNITTFSTHKLIYNSINEYNINVHKFIWCKIQYFIDCFLFKKETTCAVQMVDLVKHASYITNQYSEKDNNMDKHLEKLDGIGAVELDNGALVKFLLLMTQIMILFLLTSMFNKIPYKGYRWIDFEELYKVSIDLWCQMSTNAFQKVRAVLRFYGIVLPHKSTILKPYMKKAIPADSVMRTAPNQNMANQQVNDPYTQVWGKLTNLIGDEAEIKKHKHIIIHVDEYSVKPDVGFYSNMVMGMASNISLVAKNMISFFVTSVNTKYKYTTTMKPVAKLKGVWVYSWLLDSLEKQFLINKEVLAICMDGHQINRDAYERLLCPHQNLPGDKKPTYSSCKECQKDNKKEWRENLNIKHQLVKRWPSFIKFKNKKTHVLFCHIHIIKNIWHNWMGCYRRKEKFVYPAFEYVDANGDTIKVPRGVADWELIRKLGWQEKGKKGLFRVARMNMKLIKNKN